MTDLFDMGTPEPGPRHGEHRSRRDRRQENLNGTGAAPAGRGGRGALLIVGALAVLAVALYFAAPMVTGLFNRGSAADFPGPGTGSVMVEIPAGSSGAAMGSILYDANVVASSEAFVEAYTADPNATSIQAGFYNLRLEMSAAGAVAALQDRANRAEVSITVVEGQRAAVIFERISMSTGIPVEEIQAAAADTESYGLPAEAGGSIEGWLGAQTYILPPNVDASTVLRTMVEQTVRVLESLNIPREQWQESLIKASIAEREGVPADFGKVVRVIINRSEPSNTETVGMLGMDSVVLYGLGLDGVLLTNEQKQIDTPFNTFMHAGLPPTPICSPSNAAIEATVDPPEGTWNYFVTVNLDTGETRFATTYEEFLVYVQEWRDWLAANPDAHPGTGDPDPGVGSTN